jgi:hypothetical protein
MKCNEHQKDAERLPYLDWHDKAHKTFRKGQRQRQCNECERWFFPWELKSCP